MNELVNSVKTKGIFEKHDWLSKFDQEKIEQLIKKLKPLKGQDDSIVVTNTKMLIKKIIKFKFISVFRSIYFHNLAKKLNLKETAEQILDSKVRLTRIDHFWSPQSSNPVIQWHVDNAYSGRKNIKVFNKPDKQAIKFFFYLTNVSSDNGCLSYIPYSHKISYALKKGIYEGYIEYQPYWSLFDFRQIILKKENYNYIKKLVDEKIIIDFLNTSELILSNKIDERLFDHKINKGGALIFDEAGAHKGSRTISNDRMVLRFFYQRS